MAEGTFREVWKDLTNVDRSWTSLTKTMTGQNQDLIDHFLTIGKSTSWPLIWYFTGKKRTRNEGVMCKTVKIGPILSQICLSIRPIFTVLPITSSFLIHFQPVKYRIKGLDVLFPMVRKWLIKSWFLPSHFSSQTLVKPGETLPNLVKCALGHVKGFLPCSSYFRTNLDSCQYPRKSQGWK